jgi:hypothetical protein
MRVKASSKSARRQEIAPSSSQKVRSRVLRTSSYGRSEPTTRRLNGSRTEPAFQHATPKQRTATFLRSAMDVASDRCPMLSSRAGGVSGLDLGLAVAGLTMGMWRAVSGRTGALAQTTGCVIRPLFDKVGSAATPPRPLLFGQVIPTFLTASFHVSIALIWIKAGTPLRVFHSIVILFGVACRTFGSRDRVAGDWRCLD